MSHHPIIEILLIEDSPTDAELTLRALRKHHLANHVLHLADGQAALDWLYGTGTQAGPAANQLPQVVLLDLKMPKVGGLEVLRAIRADARTRCLPVVVMTSSQEPQDLIESYHLGANSYVVKPVDSEAFAAAIAELGHYWLLVNKTPGGITRKGIL